MTAKTTFVFFLCVKEEKGYSQSLGSHQKETFRKSSLY